MRQIKTRCCGTILPAQQHKKHETTCPEDEIECNYGCGRFEKRRLMQEHLKDVRLMERHFKAAILRINVLFHRLPWSAMPWKMVHMMDEATMDSMPFSEVSLDEETRRLLFEEKTKFKIPAHPKGSRWDSFEGFIQEQKETKEVKALNPPPLVQLCVACETEQVAGQRLCGKCVIFEGGSPIPEHCLGCPLCHQTGSGCQDCYKQHTIGTTPFYSHVSAAEDLDVQAAIERSRNPSLPRNVRVRAPHPADRDIMSDLYRDEPEDEQSGVEAVD
jgi:hypothetical protein